MASEGVITLLRVHGSLILTKTSPLAQFLMELSLCLYYTRRIFLVRDIRVRKVLGSDAYWLQEGVELMMLTKDFTKCREVRLMFMVF